MPPAQPRLELLSSLTDEHVLRALMRQRRMTRAELAAETGISKPTVGESVRRLTEAGLVADTGERTPGGRGKGRVGTYYALAGGLGAALAISIAPEGIAAEAIDVYGATWWQATEKVAKPAQPQPVEQALRAITAQAVAAAPVLRLAVVSAADPVDRATGRLVHLPSSPFLIGELDPVAILTPYVGGPVTVDNDVNWAAQAERAETGSANFAYLYLGEGLGAALVTDGALRHGHTGLAGEAAHLLTTGPAGQAMPFVDVFAHLDLCQPHSTAIDIDRLLTALTDPATQQALTQAIGGVLRALIALADPELIVIGGPWGTHPALLPLLTPDHLHLPWPVPLRPAAVTGDPPLAGARADALHRLRDCVLAQPR